MYFTKPASVLKLNIWIKLQSNNNPRCYYAITAHFLPCCLCQYSSWNADIIWNTNSSMHDAKQRLTHSGQLRAISITLTTVHTGFNNTPRPSQQNNNNGNPDAFSHIWQLTYSQEVYRVTVSVVMSRCIRSMISITVSGSHWTLGLETASSG